MTAVYITIDTEYAAGFAARGVLSAADRRENFRLSIEGRTDSGCAGIGYQMDVFERHGLKAVFFVDPMPALVWGIEAITDVVGPIIDRGHDVQLHAHSEWLALSGSQNPLGGRTGQNMADFTFEEQCEILAYASQALVAAGAQKPVAFRAGNYGANDDTLRALAEIGIAYDSSHCPGIANSACRISLGPEDRLPLRHCGVTEVPVGCIAGAVNGLRHFQLTALTDREMVAALRHARDEKQPSITLVSHSFELLSRDRRSVNHIVKRRFERFCAALSGLEGVGHATYRSAPPTPFAGKVAEPLPPSMLRTGLRYAEQAIANVVYGAR
ncbi:hypothetical protein GCM10011494_15930 [Novosphingobium endophyticum]|uniref:Chitooligosaccharide deacetylase n=1 Tax=Novosphingobium endophyticum TaxID=1955250 RepID=A0A916TRE3_9SPHN|nr:polysaccharide deacetylase family protein [Novosphingobium endophyticum]GGB98269.1 hypothetical protein GCM10011494_15930 [Novosphingobium endophyticum]